MKISDNIKSYFALFLIGIAACILCQLTDFLPYEESLWSLSINSNSFWVLGLSDCIAQ